MYPPTQTTRLFASWGHLYLLVRFSVGHRVMAKCILQCRTCRHRVSLPILNCITITRPIRRWCSSSVTTFEIVIWACRIIGQMPLVFSIHIRLAVSRGHLHTHWAVLEALRDVMSRLNAGQEIQQEAQNVERKCERHDPLEDRSDVLLTGGVGGSKHYRERKFDQDEGEFHPERDAEDAMVSIMDS